MRISRGWVFDKGMVIGGSENCIRLVALCPYSGPLLFKLVPNALRYLSSPVYPYWEGASLHELSTELFGW